MHPAIIVKDREKFTRRLEKAGVKNFVDILNYALEAGEIDLVMWRGKNGKRRRKVK